MKPLRTVPLQIGLKLQFSAGVLGVHVADLAGSNRLNTVHNKLSSAYEAPARTTLLRPNALAR